MGNLVLSLVFGQLANHRVPRRLNRQHFLQAVPVALHRHFLLGNRQASPRATLLANQVLSHRSLRLENRHHYHQVSPAVSLVINRQGDQRADPGGCQLVCRPRLRQVALVGDPPVCQVKCRLQFRVTILLPSPLGFQRQLLLVLRLQNPPISHREIRLQILPRCLVRNPPGNRAVNLVLYQARFRQRYLLVFLLSHPLDSLLPLPRSAQLACPVVAHQFCRPQGPLYFPVVSLLFNPLLHLVPPRLDYQLRSPLPSQPLVHLLCHQRSPLSSHRGSRRAAQLLFHRRNQRYSLQDSLQILQLRRQQEYPLVCRVVIPLEPPQGYRVVNRHHNLHSNRRRDQLGGLRWSQHRTRAYPRLFPRHQDQVLHRQLGRMSLSIL